jgi:osmotically-inducible protein OsmY
MRIIATIAICFCLFTLVGCGSLLASMNSDSIDDQPNERTMGQIVEDDNIETKATVNIHAAIEAYDDAHLVIVCYNGFVLLAGQVNDKVLKARATAVVREIPGVRRIYNELEIGPATAAMTRTNDTWITTKIKSSLLGSSDIQGTRIKVVTENSVVYLMGIVTRKEADVISEKAASTSGVKRVVRLFELRD